MSLADWGDSYMTRNALLGLVLGSCLLPGLAAAQANDPTKLVDKRLQAVGIDPTPKQAPGTLEAFVEAELAKWTPIAKASGVQLD